MRRGAVGGVLAGAPERNDRPAARVRVRPRLQLLLRRELVAEGNLPQPPRVPRVSLTPPPPTHTHTHTHTNARTHLYTHKPDNSTPVNALSDPWSQARCGAACDAQGAACTAFVYGYEAYEVGGKDAGVAPGCSDAQPACLFSNPDPLCHVPRCYLRNVRNLSCGAESCGTGATGFPGGGSVGCSQKDASGALLPWGEFSLYKKGKHW